MPLEAAFAALTIGDGVARGVVRRAHARRLCDGHFPGEPIVPGAYLAGLMAELAAALVAEYRDVRVHAAAHAGPLRFAARLERRVLHFWRCRVEVRDAAGTLLLEGTVTLAPEPAR